MKNNQSTTASVLLRDTKTLVTASLFAALTCAATMVIKIPTPTMGYVHPGDSLVLLCGIFLGPLAGGLASGIGSMFADIFSGYFIYAIPTLIIKGLCAVIASVAFRKVRGFLTTKKAGITSMPALIVCGILAETIMVAGYFINKIINTMILLTSFSHESFLTGIANAVTDAPFNVVQGVTGIILALIIFPVLSKVPELNKHIN